MSTLTLQSENTASYSTQSKNTGTLSTSLRHGKEPILDDIKDKTFTDPLYDTSSKELKDYTFAELQNQQWTLQSKN